VSPIPVVCLDVDVRDVAFAGAAEQARMLAEGKITAPALLDIYLDRIARLDPQLNSFRVVLESSARQEAKDAQTRLDAGERLPLLGVPVAIKDDIDVAGQLTTFGSDAVSTPKSADAEVVRRLREAGAVIIGKTNVPELMMLPMCESKTFGATRNPWNTDLTPGGSSGGNGAALAAGLVPLAVGSDGGGSIRIPSSWCGLYGLKTSRDLVPLAPRDEPWCGLDVYGPMARSVEDVALFLDVASSTPGPGGSFVAAAAKGPGQLRIAWSTRVPPLVSDKVGDKQKAAVKAAAEDLLRDTLGHVVEHRDQDLPLLTIYGYYLPRYLRGVRNDAHPLPHKNRLEIRTRCMAFLGSLFPACFIRWIRGREENIRKRVLPLLEDFDVLITPGNAQGPSRIGAYRCKGPVLSLLAASDRVPFYEVPNMTGQPAAVVPWELDDDGIPVSIQLIARPGDEATLLALSAQIEKHHAWAHRRPLVS
jgi:amidase